MSERGKSFLNWGLIIAATGVVVTAMGLLFNIARSMWTIASGWGGAMQRMESIDKGLKEHVEQTKEFRIEFEKRLRAIENRVGIVMSERGSR